MSIEEYDLDKRNEPRFKTRLPAEVRTECGESASGIIANISVSGLQLFTNNHGLSTLLPNFKRENLGEAVTTTISFSVPVSKENIEVLERVSVTANIVYTRRVHVDVFAIGCAFSKFLGQSEQHLTDYIYYFCEPL